MQCGVGAVAWPLRPVPKQPLYGFYVPVRKKPRETMFMSTCLALFMNAPCLSGMTEVGVLLLEYLILNRTGAGAGTGTGSASVLLLVVDSLTSH